jgi:hypothetical protein
MCAMARFGDDCRMTNDNASRRGWWLGATVAVLAVAVTGRELIRSGTVAGDFTSHWYGQAGMAAIAVAVAGAALYMLHRAYRDRTGR